jgi:hypothetical protein
MPTATATMKVRLPLPHAGAKPIPLFFGQIGPPWAEAALHAALPAVLHALTHVSPPTRSAQEHGHADANQEQGPEQVQIRGVNEPKVLEHSEDANGDECEWKDAHGSPQQKNDLARGR